MLIQLLNNSEDPKIKDEAMCLATYEIENFEYLLVMNIWYDILFAANLCVKSLQPKEMYIDIAIDQLKSLINYFKNYRENDFPSAKSMAIEPKHII